jgi:phenylalanyl-tRNA synthetase beta subunit
VGELDLTALQAHIRTKKKAANYTTLQDHHTSKDLNFLLPQTMDFGTVTDAVRRIKEIAQVDVFDLYAGEHIPEDKKSISLRIHLHRASKDGERSQEEQANVLQKAIDAVTKVGAELRA